MTGEVPAPLLHTWDYIHTHTHHLLTGLLPIHKALGDGIGCQDFIPTVGGEGWGRRVIANRHPGWHGLRVTNGYNNDDNNKNSKKNEHSVIY